MKKTIALILFCICLSFTSMGQGVLGAWENQTTSENGVQIKNIVIFSKGYQVSTWFEARTGKFIMTNGGAWKLDGDTMTETIEFDTNKPERVGSEISFKVSINDTILQVAGDKRKWHRIDNGNPGDLQGAWLMSGRKRNGQLQQRDINRPRKTMKILSGTRFQWIAYNTETKQFMGTGGGTYTTINGKYTEKIGFFSRDDTRVGQNLEFNYNIVDGKWQHTGFSSKGDPMHEIWSKRK